MQLVEVPFTFMRPHMNVVGCITAISVYLLSVTAMQQSFGLSGIALTSVSAAFLSNILLMIVFW